MPRYFFPGRLPETVQQHLAQFQITAEYNVRIETPYPALGTILSQEEVVECRQFRFLTGLDANDEPIEKAQPTNLEDVLLIELNGTPTQEQLAEYNQYIVTYENGATHLARALSEIAQELQTNIHAVTGKQFRCYESHGACRNCPKDEPPLQVSEPVVRFDCGGRQIRTIEIHSLYSHAVIGNRTADFIRSRTLEPEGDDVIVDQNGTVVAEIYNGEVRILVWLELETNNYYGQRIEPWTPSEEILKAILRDAIPKILEEKKTGVKRPITPRYLRDVQLRKELLAKGNERAKEEYLKTPTFSAQKAIETAEENVRRHTQRAEEYLALYIREQRLAEEEQQKVNYLRDHGEEELRDKLRRQLTNILNMPDIIGIESVGGNLIIYTRLLYMEHNGKKYRIGAFKMSIGPDYGIMVENMTKVVGRYHHPNIENGYTCWGNIGHDVIQAVQDYELEVFVNFTILFIRTYNEGHHWADIASWPEERE